MLRPMPDTIADERHVRLFRNGRNQAVRIPREFELPGEEAILRKEGNRLVLEPIVKSSILDVLAGMEPIDEEFEIADLPAEPFDL
jgi:antitoxin VapB